MAYPVSVFLSFAVVLGHFQCGNTSKIVRYVDIFVVLTATFFPIGECKAYQCQECNQPYRRVKKTMRVKPFTTFAGAALLAIAASLTATSTADAQILNQVRSRGTVRCGVNGQLPGFSSVDSAGNHFGFDVDLCRAVSAAVFGTPDNVEYITLTSANRQSALQAGEIDLLSRNTTYTLTRDSEWGATYGPTTFYDGQGFLVPAESGVTTVEELDGATICVLAGTTTELNLADVFRARGLSFTPVVFDTDDASFGAYDEGRCDVNTSDVSTLVSRRTTLGEPDAHIIMGEVISKEPLGPLVPQGDEQWSDIMDWTVFALFYAEEAGITSENIGTFAGSEDPNIQRFLGQDGNLGEILGLDSDFTVNVIESVGNYGEMFETHLTPLGITERGFNASYVDGGLLYAPPFR
ncbi:MAG: amino acid ABC transporter substrate-binding protein [Synechococcus sp.]